MSKQFQHKLATPKTLIEAIQNGHSDDGTIAGLDRSIQMHVKDFLAQKFGTAILETYGNPNAEEALKKLWEKIIGDECPKKS